MNHRFSCYGWTVSVLGILLLVSLAAKLAAGPFDHTLSPGVSVLLALYLVSGSWIVQGLEGGVVFTASPILLFSLLLLGGPPLAALAFAAQITYSNLCIRKVRDSRVLFNIGQGVISIAFAGWVYAQLGGVTGLSDINSLLVLSAWLPAQLIGAHLAYIVLNTSFASTYIALRDRRSPWFYWRTNYLPMAWKSFATPVAALVVSRLFLAQELLGVVLFFCMILLDYFHARAKVNILQSRNHAVETLLTISGVTKPYSQDEAAERASLATEMGQQLHLPQSRLEVLRDAVRLHNIGYVGVDPSTLRRKGALSESEMETVQQHPLIGARILLRVPALREVAWLVLCHHERPDGRGYPLRLNAGEAPTESYIIATVEGYCSLKYGRDHQDALGGDEALERIISLAGTRYDRAAVAALARASGRPLTPELEPYLRRCTSRGDPHLKKQHLERIAPPESDLGAEDLRLFASLRVPPAETDPGARLRAWRHATLTPRDAARGHILLLSLALFTLAAVCYPLVMELHRPLGFLTAPLHQLVVWSLWAAVTGMASLLFIRLPAGASVSAASSVALAGSLLEGPLLGVALGAITGAMSYILGREHTPGGRSSRQSPARRPAPHLSAPRPDLLARFARRISAPGLALPATYALAAALPGLMVQLSGGLATPRGAFGPSWMSVALVALAAIALYGLVETGALSLLHLSPPGRRGADAIGRRSKSLIADPSATPFGPIPQRQPPLPLPLTPWERWRANYRALFPEPLAYPAAGLLMALAYQAIGPWSLGVILVYPVLWSHVRLEERLRLSDCHLRLLLSISQAIDERHHYTQGHSVRVALWASALARQMGYSEEFAREMRLAGVLHDLGKASWTDAMLEKPRKLTAPENRLKEEHPVLSALVARASFPQVETAILQHHEDWDGSGYPHRIEGPQATPGARILRVADTIDAIGSGRPYKVKEGRKDPIEEIMRCAHTDFDPAVVAALARMVGVVPDARHAPRREQLTATLASLAARPREAWQVACEDLTWIRRRGAGILLGPLHRVWEEIGSLSASFPGLLPAEPATPARAPGEERPGEAERERPRRASVRLRDLHEECREWGDAVVSLPPSVGLVAPHAGGNGGLPLRAADAGRHGERVAVLADLLARAAGMPGGEREELRRAALAHHESCGWWHEDWWLTRKRFTYRDLDRLATQPHRIRAGLLAPGREGRARRMRRHQQERWDGRGYPAGLAGEAIPLGARVLALACAFDRLLVPLPFRRPLSPEAALQALTAKSGGAFDARLADLLTSAVGRGGTRQALAGLGLPAPGYGTPAWDEPEVPGDALPPASAEARQPLARLRLQGERLVARAVELGLAPETAELLALRYELPGGKGPLRIEWYDLPPPVARFQLELLLLDVLRHQRRPLTPAVLARALELMGGFAGWAAPEEALAAFRAETAARGLPAIAGFAEFDRLTGSAELGPERARDEALLFAYSCWTEGMGEVALPVEAAAEEPLLL